MAWLDRQAKESPGQPFFLYLAPSAPHEPALWSTVPEFVKGTSAAGPRGDLVALVDWMVGQVVEALDRHGQGDGTLVLVTSDNGALPGHSASMDGRGPWDTFGHKSCGDWRGYKSHIWEGGHREPLIARWPGRIAPGTVCAEPVELTDLMATVAALLGTALPAAAGEDSYDILPALLGHALDAPIREALVHHSVFSVFSIRQGRWKLIVGTETSGGWPPPRGEGPQPGARGQLYDLAADPAEARNLWGGRPDVVARLTALLDRYRASGRSASRPRTASPSE
ncbi:MAG: sulfatase-like hydrolase/transferase [Planctomycetota bacterium]